MNFKTKPNEITAETYHRSEEYKKYISSSVLKQMLVSPKWMRYCQLNPDDKRIGLEVQLKGNVYHDMLASITNCGGLKDFYNTWVVFTPPVNDKTGKAYGYTSLKFTDAYESFKAANEGKEVCSQTEIDMANAMIEELLNGNSHLSSDVKFLIKHGKAEVSHFAEYEDLFFKYRTDLETNTKIVDWKSCGFEEPKIENWGRKAIKYGYDISAAFYQYFEFISTGKWKKFYWVAQEKEPPFDFNIIDAGNFAFEIYNGEFKDSVIIPEDSENFSFKTETQIAVAGPGAIKMLKLLEEYIYCSDKNAWPGYSIFTKPDWKNRRIAQSDVPGWDKANSFYND